ncbi:MAG: transcription/translation regulatory transformer protein RfaH [Moraxellaceae bacterium]|nr:transcription/translation regulatory transformer protein RfaH [Moraxellaceae bacterium]
MTIYRHSSDELMTDRHWYLVQCKPRECFRALDHLKNQAFEAFLPTRSREVVRRGKCQVIEEPLFPHYLFVRLSDVADNWAPLRSTRGVARVVRFGDIPLSVPDDIVSALQQPVPAAPQAMYSVGDKVQITQGALAGLDAIFAASDGDERVVLLIKLLHQDQMVKVPLSQVRRSD